MQPGIAFWPRKCCPFKGNNHIQICPPARAQNTDGATPALSRLIACVHLDNLHLCLSISLNGTRVKEAPFRRFSPPAPASPLLTGYWVNKLLIPAQPQGLERGYSRGWWRSSRRRWFWRSDGSWTRGTNNSWRTLPFNAMHCYGTSNNQLVCTMGSSVEFNGSNGRLWIVTGLKLIIV